MKKLLLVALMVLSVGLLSACTTQNEGFFSLNSKEEEIGFGALTSVMALSDAQSEMTPVSSNSTGSLQPLAFGDVLEQLAEIESLKPYLEMVSAFSLKEDVLDVEVETLVDHEYTYKMVIRFTNLAGEQEAYEMFYNETSWEAETEITVENETGEENDDDDDDEAEEFERKSIIEGILIMGEDTYIVNGRRNIEDEEEKFSLTAKLDEDNYVVFKQKTETEEDETETKFEYSFYSNGELVRKVEMKFEDETDEDETESETYIKIYENGEVSTFKFEMEEEDGEVTLEVKFEIYVDGIFKSGKAEVTMTFNSATGEYDIEVEIKDEETVVEDDDDEDDDNDDDDNDDDDDEVEDTTEEETTEV